MLLSVGAIDVIFKALDRVKWSLPLVPGRVGGIRFGYDKCQWDVFDKVEGATY